MTDDCNCKENCQMYDDGFPVKSKKFRNKKTGEIVTRFSLLEINDYEPVIENKSRFGHDS